MDKTILTSRIEKIFTNYEDKVNLSFKNVKTIYNENNEELSKDDSKFAKKLLMKLYIEYSEKSGNNNVLTENQPQKRPRKDSEEQANIDSEDKENCNVSLVKPDRKMRKINNDEDKVEEKKEEIVDKKDSEVIKLYKFF